MKTYFGTLQNLQEIVNNSPLKGDWTTTPTGAHKFTCVNGGILLWYPSTGTLQRQGKPHAAAHIDDLINNIFVPSAKVNVSPEDIRPVYADPTVFIVYGHDEDSRNALELALTKIQVKYVILAKESGRGNTIIEALEGHIGKNGKANIGIVLLTPDDMGYAVRDGEAAIKGRARQNVILEFGMLIAKLGRQNTIMVVKDGVERPSDTDGILYLGYKKSVNECVQKLVTRLEECGCSIDHKVARLLSK